MLARKLLQVIGGQGAPSGGASYRYWRLYITAVNAGGDTSAVVEMELRGSVGGTDLTSPSTPVLESSVFAAGGVYSGPATVDNNTGSYWLSGAGMPQWLRYDLGSAAVVAQVSIDAYLDSGSCPRDFKIQGSADGSSWVDVKTFTATPVWAGPQAFTI